MKTPGLENKANKNGEAAPENGDIYAGFGGAYKATLMKMVGSNMASGSNVATKDTEVSQAKRQNATEASLREMRIQGAQQFAAEQKKRPVLSYFINKASEHYDLSKARAFLKEEEFLERVNFKFGVPLTVLDLIDYLTGSDFISTIQKTYVNPQNHIERFDTTNEDFNALKNKIDEDFLPFIFQIFNALGNIDLKDLAKNSTQEEKESKQYLTLGSMKRNLPKVFGIKNDFFAEMLFLFISGHAPLTNIINFHQFFSRLEVFWPRKELIPDYEDRASREWRERNARQARKAAMRNFMFEFIRVSGGRLITILDLVKLCCYFKEDSCKFGEECEVLMKKYKQLNIEPKYVHEITEFGF